MLKKLTLKYYRSYRNQEFEFHPGINGLIGLSQSGKTNVIRALILLAYNRPSGKGYHSNFARENTKTVVKLLDDNNYTISLEKSSSTAVYKIDHPVHGNHEFKKFGTKVPDLISEVLNISTINIQDQIDRVFLAASSPAEIARTINKITKVEEVDVWVKNVNSKVSYLNSKKAGLTDDIAEIEDKLSELNELHIIDRKISRIEKLRSKKDKLDSRYMAILDIANKIEDAEFEIETCKKMMPAKKYIDKIVKLANELEVIAEQISIINDYLINEQNINELKLKLEKYVSRYIKILKKEKRCPFCFSNITTKQVRRIVDELHTA